MDIGYKEIFGAISLLIVIPQTYVYIKSILIGESKPHIYTRLIWMIVVGIGFLMQVSYGGGPGTWLLGISFATQLLIFLMSFKYGTKDISRMDTYLLVLALGVIPLYFGIENAIYSLILIIFIDTLAYLPTFRKTFRDPTSESVLAFSLGILKYSFSILALASYSIYTLVYPLSIVIANTLLVGMILYRRQQN